MMLGLVSARTTAEVDLDLVSEVLLHKFNTFTVHDPNALTDYCVTQFSSNILQVAKQMVLIRSQFEISLKIIKVE